MEGDEGINCGIRIGKKYLLEDAPRKFSRFTGNANEQVPTHCVWSFFCSSDKESDSLIKPVRRFFPR